MNREDREFHDAWKRSIKESEEEDRIRTKQLREKQAEIERQRRDDDARRQSRLNAARVEQEKQEADDNAVAMQVAAEHERIREAERQKLKQEHENWLANLNNSNAKNVFIFNSVEVDIHNFQRTWSTDLFHVQAGIYSQGAFPVEMNIKIGKDGSFTIPDGRVFMRSGNNVYGSDGSYFQDTVPAHIYLPVDPILEKTFLDSYRRKQVEKAARRAEHVDFFIKRPAKFISYGLVKSVLDKMYNRDTSVAAAAIISAGIYVSTGTIAYLYTSHQQQLLAAYPALSVYRDGHMNFNMMEAPVTADAIDNASKTCSYKSTTNCVSIGTIPAKTNACIVYAHGRNPQNQYHVEIVNNFSASKLAKKKSECVLSAPMQTPEQIQACRIGDIKYFCNGAEQYQAVKALSLEDNFLTQALRERIRLAEDGMSAPFTRQDIERFLEKKAKALEKSPVRADSNVQDFLRRSGRDTARNEFFTSAAPTPLKNRPDETGTATTIFAKTSCMVTSTLIPTVANGHVHITGFDKDGNKFTGFAERKNLQDIPTSDTCNVSVMAKNDVEPTQQPSVTKKALAPVYNYYVTPFDQYMTDENNRIIGGLKKDSCVRLYNQHGVQSNNVRIRVDFGKGPFVAYVPEKNITLGGQKEIGTCFASPSR